MTVFIEVSTTTLSTLRNEILLLVMLHLAWSGMVACCVDAALSGCCPVSSNFHFYIQLF